MAGGGPAGCAAAIVLAGAGASVVVYGSSAHGRARVGETLPPEVRLPLDRLGVWDRFLADGHGPAPGMVAAWGGAEPYDNDFILNPFGCGWRIDRDRFDATLSERAAEAGAVVRAGRRVTRCGRDVRGAWHVEVDGEPTMGAGFLVDATGRSPSLAGARRVACDRMVALVGSAPSAGGDERAFIEATQDGWWYSARLPGGRLAMTFQTDPAPGLLRRWDEFLAGAPGTAARAGGPAQDIRIVSANSDRSDPVAGDAWLAVGDAACAHDPITGLGIHWAMESGIAGAEAILAASVTAYARDIHERFHRYLAARVEYYRAEARWPEAPFWARRRRPPV